MSGHTPGPWTVAPTKHRNGEATAEIHHGNDGEVVCIMEAHDDDRSRADARLIAAAPDLLEANEIALSAMEQMWKDYMSDRHPNLEQINDAMKGLRAALAPAKGEG